jgi:hypothetical protein
MFSDEYVIQSEQRRVWTILGSGVEHRFVEVVSRLRMIGAVSADGTTPVTDGGGYAESTEPAERFMR